MSWTLQLSTPPSTMELTRNWGFLTTVSHFKAFLLKNWNSVGKLMKTGRNKSPCGKRAKTKNWKGLCALGECRGEQGKKWCEEEKMKAELKRANSWVKDKSRKALKIVSRKVKTYREMCRGLTATCAVFPLCAAVRITYITMSCRWANGGVLLVCMGSPVSVAENPEATAAGDTVGAEQHTGEQSVLKTKCPHCSHSKACTAGWLWPADSTPASRGCVSGVLCAYLSV